MERTRQMLAIRLDLPTSYIMPALSATIGAKPAELNIASNGLNHVKLLPSFFPIIEYMSCVLTLVVLRTSKLIEIFLQLFALADQVSVGSSHKQVMDGSERSPVVFPTQG